MYGISLATPSVLMRALNTSVTRPPIVPAAPPTTPAMATWFQSTVLLVKPWARTLEPTPARIPDTSPGGETCRYAQHACPDSSASLEP